MHCFLLLQIDGSVELPRLFTNPFYYEPHPLCLLAVEELKQSLPDKLSKGKMYGVLVVQDNESNIGYLAAYSGNDKTEKSQVPFVPQVFDITNKDGFFRKEEKELSALNEKISELEHSKQVKVLSEKLADNKGTAELELKKSKQQLKTNKKLREETRKELVQKHTGEELDEKLADLIKESQREKSIHTQLKKTWAAKINEEELKLNALLEQISLLKQKRKQQSTQLQDKLFSHYRFLNKDGQVKNALEIFKTTSQKIPPAGTGDCAAPKLLNYAFEHQLKPIAMAEVWWGPSPKTEIRHHAHFYPACNGKCKPLLTHMLKGIDLDHTHVPSEQSLSIEIIYEDKDIAVINKPAGLLSTPGKEMTDSVFDQARELFPQAEGPLLVHRLDMATSGLMLIAKNKKAHELLQKQFLNKKIQKRYVALLDGHISKDEGCIDLPLRVDLDDRPRQMVCYEHGKPALTKWKVIKRDKNTTLVYFYPITGRTHQLRVHAAHAEGLNTPIVGDTLYGQRNKRLMLHAEHIKFVHPGKGEVMMFRVEADF
jgi:tRNA pseudouridine32 synthase/23S rRNA pseudouridine746 synthase